MATDQKEQADTKVNGAMVLGQFTTYLGDLERRLYALESENTHLRQKVAALQRLVPNRVTIDMTKVNFTGFEKGSRFESKEFVLFGMDGFTIRLYPKGDKTAPDGRCSLYLNKPSGPSARLMHRMTLDGETRQLSKVREFEAEGWGWRDFSSASDSFSTLVVEVVEVEHTIVATA